ncbi:DNA polymerase III subunit chi [Candidatus Erwinia haradaeae]|uniref:DNA polymerase III subunit chi n=1 Tax=Candidatus Erwinia haradaeae TaxID=1922217 RepID=A0A451DAI1_9GAMM|nr:DNA polymerase III subunit chi [Candidatus Erwinia haradaeae]VFP83353.1 DNA polymerase III subunit chi [Candidatus Erwinia haradaeae]
MKKATFYLLWSNPPSEEIDDQEKWICGLIHAKWRSSRKRIIIACINKTQAIRLDEALWRWSPYTFLPHNLIGEGPMHGAPVELVWPKKNLNTSYDILINLLPECIDYASSFSEIIDFVPSEESCKKLARIRYKKYRNLGFTLFTRPLSDI